MGDPNLPAVVTTVVLLIILLMSGVAANSVLLLAFHRRPALRTTSNRFVGNLLVVNLLSTCLLIPLTCVDIAPSAAWWPQSPLSLCVVDEFVSAWVSSASLFATLLIALDQYMAITFPLRYHGLTAGTRSWFLLAAAWLAAMVVALVSVVGQQHPSLWYGCDVPASHIPELTSDLAYPVIVFSVLFVVPTLLVAVIYGRIYLEAHANCERMRRGSNSTVMAGGSPTHEIATEPLVRFERRNSADLITEPAVKSKQASGLLKHSKTSACLSANKNQAPTLKRSQTTGQQLMHSLRHKISNASLFMQRHKDELHTARISLVIVVLVLVCWLPHHISLLLLSTKHTLSAGVPLWTRSVTHVLVVLYPVLSPCVFAYRCKRLQKELKRLFYGRGSGTDIFRGSDCEQLHHKHCQLIRVLLHPEHFHSPIHFHFPHCLTANTSFIREKDNKVTTTKAPVLPQTDNHLNKATGVDDKSHRSSISSVSSGHSTDSHSSEEPVERPHRVKFFIEE